MEEEQSPTDHEAFLRLFTRCEGNLRAFVASLLPTWEGVDDVMQETSIVLWRKFSEFGQSDSGADFLGWAFMIARYEVPKDRRRRATDRFRLSDDVFDLLANEAATVAEQQRKREQALQECVQHLEAGQRKLGKSRCRPQR